MLNVLKKPAAETPNGSGRGMQLLQFELALDLAGLGEKRLAETLSHAAETVGADLVFMLPAADGNGERGIVRLNDDANSSFIQVEAQDTGFAILDETQIAEPVLALARATVDVFGRIQADAALRETMAAP